MRTVFRNHTLNSSHTWSSAKEIVAACMCEHNYVCVAMTAASGEHDTLFRVEDALGFVLR